MEDKKQATIFLAFTIGSSSVSALFCQLALTLSKSFKVVIFSDRHRPFPFPSEHIEIAYWPSPRPTKFRDYRFLQKNIKKYSPQLMLSTFGANNLFALCGFLNKVPHRLMTHRTISSHFASTSFKVLRKKWIFRLATDIIANSEATKEDLLDVFGVPSQKVTVLPNGVIDPEITNERDDNLIAYAGNLSKNKGTEVLLQAFRNLLKEKPTMQLHLMGGSQNVVEKYKAMAADLEIESNTVFYGSQPKEKVLELFSKASFSVAPSLSEGFGFVVIEAFSVRTPVIGSRTGGIKDIIRDGKDGLLVIPGDVESLSNAMLQFLNTENATLNFGEKAYERFLDRFEIHSVVDKFASYLTNKINS